MPNKNHLSMPSRRDLLVGALGSAGALTAGIVDSHNLLAAGAERLRVGLVGCGGRGTGAACQAALAHPSVRIVAMGDLFADHLAESAQLLQATVGTQFDCPGDHRFVGARAWQQVLDSDIDAVILAATPASRPEQFAAAVARGLHIYCERPAAIDFQGLEGVRAACHVARTRGLVVSSGLARRHHRPTVDTIDRIQSGAIGRPFRAVCEAYLGLAWHRSLEPSWTTQEYQQRNWVSAQGLGGALLVEAHLDALDCALWAMGDTRPVVAAPDHSSDGQAVRYRFADGRELRARICRSAIATHRTTERVLGTGGTADLLGHRIEGPRPWRSDSLAENPWQACMTRFVDAILAGLGGDEGAPLVGSTFVALMGLAAMQAGREVSAGAAATALDDSTGII